MVKSPAMIDELAPGYTHLGAVLECSRAMLARSAWIWGSVVEAFSLFGLDFTTAG